MLEGTLERQEVWEHVLGDVLRLQVGNCLDLWGKVGQAEAKKRIQLQLSVCVGHGPSHMLVLKREKVYNVPASRLIVVQPHKYPDTEEAT